MAGRHDRPSEFRARASDVPVAEDPASADAQVRDVTIDVLSDVFRSIRLTAALFFPLEASSPWADQIPAASGLASSILPGAQHVVSYHIVSRGACWLTLSGHGAVPLEAGDVILIPHGDPYVMSSAPGLRPEMATDAVLSFFRQMATETAPSVLVEGGGGAERTELICGFLGCDRRPFNPVLAALPRVVHLRRHAESAVCDRLTPLIALGIAESRQRRPGAVSVLLRLGELLFIEVVRHYLDALPADRTGWLSGLRDPLIGRALALMHGQAAENWTLERLAHDVGASRSTLADRFAHLIGEPPMRYLAQWRMQVASRMLVEGTAKVSAVAFEVGYRSEAAFSRAFKQIVGVSPVDWRRTRGAGPTTGGTQAPRRRPHPPRR